MVHRYSTQLSDILGTAGSVSDYSDNRTLSLSPGWGSRSTSARSNRSQQQDARSFRSQRSTASLTSDDPRMPSPAYLQNNKTLRDLSGTWTMSKSLSIGVPGALQIQGYSSPTRKALLTSPIRLSITQSHYPSQLYVRTQTHSSLPQFRPAVPPSTERWYPPQKVGMWSDWTENILEYGDGDGVVSTRGRCRWVSGSQFEHKEGIGYLTEGLARLSEFFEAEVECQRGGWRTVQVWFMERGRLVRRVVTFDDGGGKRRMMMDGRVEDVGRRAETRWVYEFEGR